jgi:transposase
MHVEAFDTPEQLRERARKQDDPLLAIRLLGVAMAMENRTAPQVAAATGYSRRTVQQWVRGYNALGIEGLHDAPGRGRKPPLVGEEVKRFCRRLNEEPRAEDGVCALRGRDVQRILHEEFGKVRSLSGTYSILHRLGYNDLMPRPRHKSADPAAQEAFKKSCRN